MTRRTISLGVTASTLLAATLFTGAASGDMDLAGLDTRISTVETQTAQNTADIKQLQAASSSPTTTPTTSTATSGGSESAGDSASATAPASSGSTPGTSTPISGTDPVPVRLVSGVWRAEPDGQGGENYYCDDTYSDGTTSTEWQGHAPAGMHLSASCD